MLATSNRWYNVSLNKSKVRFQSIEKYEKRKGANLDRFMISKKSRISVKVRQYPTGSVTRGTPLHRETTNKCQNGVESNKELNETELSSEDKESTRTLHLER
ncbi:hypothetical protein RhiirA4_484890 [Rhizophagus irregularis]|uniref:Uncharacterized protein n=1 Tax=Rhizophagus irregularis TaxID=588596 RepID=A0A2I1HPG2_9GLOM|nr:hypothetical protein RhiirA4_484890 [Rhizophagus irregularis]